MFRSLFKLSYPLIEYIWRTLKASFPQSKPKYLLWTLFFLETTSTNFQEISSFVGTTYQTLRIRVTIVLKRLIARTSEFKSAHIFEVWVK
jgi:hypothetical protein